ncbi:hypothetical protein [Endozoicomonas sp. SCSIO W0465]|uniref:hypothetical protein n=1 Tax=Endozoicomonas sp. SCSIO W0465 TaxID=2918516 RepID=UPI002074F18B|nr:hypothetical protein [Endozoicomonas sp. SCSIO W0465]USE34897.1 hypothetical protein MJO57_22630 [Endozoicomonas sp. SCSIO W0465]
MLNSYREGNDQVYFIFLDGSYDLILERMKARQGHFMKETMLQSQFNTLEVPGANEMGVARVDIASDIDQVVARAVEASASFTQEVAA